MKRAFTLILALAMALTLAGITPAARAEDDFGIGVTKDNVYWNEAIEIGCALSEEWYFYNEEELLEANGMTVEKLEGAMAEMVKEGGRMIDMLAVNLETGATVNVTYERLNLANSLFLNEQSYLTASEPVVREALGQLGIEDIEITLGSVTLLGQEHQMVFITGTYQQVPVYETLAVVKSGRNIAVITVFSVQEGEAEDVFSCFFNTLD